MRKLFYFMAAASALFFILTMACNENPLELNRNIYSLEKQGALKDTTLYAIADTTYATEKVFDTSLATRILIGSTDNMEARPILKFTSLPLNAQFLTGRIRFQSVGVLGSATGSAFAATAYPVTEEWTNNLDDIWSDYNSHIDRTKALNDEFSIPAESSDTLTMRLNQAGLDQFTTWADSATIADTTNYGMLLDYSNANFIKELTSINSGTSTWFFFKYTVGTDTTVITDSTFVTLDAFIYSGSIPNIPGRDYASTLQVYRTLLKFDLKSFLAKFPQGVLINSANLQMPIDTVHSLVDTTLGTFLQLRRIISPFNPDSVVVDSSSTLTIPFRQRSDDRTYVEVASSSYRQNLAQNYIQNQLRNIEDPYGILVEFSTFIDTYSYFSFYKRNDANPALRPRLILTYWIPPSPRF